MPIEGFEWVIIGIILIAILLWKPENVGNIIRAIAAARREFEKAQREFSEMLTLSLQNSEQQSSSLTSTITQQSRGTPAISDDPSDKRLIIVAKSLGIKTEGLTKEEVKQLLDEKLKELSSSSQGANNTTS